MHRGPRCSGSPSCARRRPARAAPRSARRPAPRRGVGHQLQRDRRPVDHLAPAPRVGRLAQPRVPKRHRVVEQPPHLGGPHLPRRPVGGALQHHPADLTRHEIDRGPHIALVDLGLGQPRIVGLAHRMQRQGQGVGAEHHPAVGQLGPVRAPAVVEPRRDVDLEPHPPAHTPHHPHQPVIRGDRTPEDRHEIHHLAHAVRGEKPGDQGGGVGEVHLLRRVGSTRGTHPEMATTGVVQQRPEHTRRVETWAAEPIDRPVGTDQRGGVQVSDKPMIGNRCLGHDDHLHEKCGTRLGRPAGTSRSSNPSWPPSSPAGDTDRSRRACGHS